MIRIERGAPYNPKHNEPKKKACGPVKKISRVRHFLSRSAYFGGRIRRMLMERCLLYSVPALEIAVVPAWAFSLSGLTCKKPLASA
jgi:hypothetical protein